MSDAFRGMAGTLERARALEEENDALRRELGLYEDVVGRGDTGVRRLFEERARLVRELAALRDRADAPARAPFITVNGLIVSAILLFVFFVVPTLVHLR